MAIGPSILEQEDALKGLPTGALQKMMRQPSGQAPLFLVAAELKRREQMAENFAGAQAGAQMAQQAPTVADRLAGQQQTMPMSQAGAMAAPPQQPPMPQDAQLAMALSGATGRPPPQLPTINAATGMSGAAVKAITDALRKEGTRSYGQRSAHKPFSSRERPPPVTPAGLALLLATIQRQQSEPERAYGGFDISKEDSFPQGRSGARAAARPVNAANGTQGRTVYAENGWPPPPPAPMLPPTRRAAGDLSSRLPTATPASLSYLKRLAASQGGDPEAYIKEQEAVLAEIKQEFGGRQKWFDELGVGTRTVPHAPSLGPQELPVGQAAPLLSPEQKRLWQGGWVDNPPAPPPEEAVPEIVTPRTKGVEERDDPRDVFGRRVDAFFAGSGSPEETRKRLWDLPIDFLKGIVTEWGPRVATKEDMSRRDDATRIWEEKRNVEAARELAMPSFAGEGPLPGQRFDQENMVPIPAAPRVPDARDPQMMAPNPQGPRPWRFNPETMKSIPTPPPPSPFVDDPSLREAFTREASFWDASGIVSDSGGGAALPVPVAAPVDNRSLAKQVFDWKVAQTERNEERNARVLARDREAVAMKKALAPFHSFDEPVSDGTADQILAGATRVTDREPVAAPVVAPVAAPVVETAAETAADIAAKQIDLAKWPTNVSRTVAVADADAKGKSSFQQTRDALQGRLDAVEQEDGADATQQATEFFNTLTDANKTAYSDLKAGLKELSAKDAKDFEQLETRFKALDDFHKTGKLPERMRQDRITNLMLEMSKGLLGNQNLYDAFRAGVEGFQAVDKAARKEYADGLSTMLTASKGIIDSKMAMRNSRRQESIAMTKFAAAENRGNASLAMDQLKIAQQAKQNARTHEINLIRGEATLLQADIAMVNAMKGSEKERLLKSMPKQMYPGILAKARETGDTTELDKYYRKDSQGKVHANITAFIPHIAGLSSSGYGIGAQIALERYRKTGRRDQAAVERNARNRAEKLITKGRQNVGWVDIANRMNKGVQPTFADWKDVNKKAAWMRMAVEYYKAIDPMSAKALAAGEKSVPEVPLDKIITVPG